MDTLLLFAEGGADFSLTGMWAQMSIFAKAVLVGLIVMFVVALAIMIERLRAYSKAKRQSINYIMLLRTYLQERKMQEAVAAAQNHPDSPVAKDSRKPVKSAAILPEMGGATMVSELQ